MNVTRIALRRLRSTLSVLLIAALLGLALDACVKSENKQIAVAAEYVRTSVNADYQAMSKVVAKKARPYCYAMAAAPKSEELPAKIARETKERDALIFEISFGSASTYLRLSPPKTDAPHEVMVESWNKQGARSTGTLTIGEESGTYVVTHVNGKPIEEVLAGGSGGL